MSTLFVVCLLEIEGSDAVAIRLEIILFICFYFLFSFVSVVLFLVRFQSVWGWNSASDRDSVGSGLLSPASTVIMLDMSLASM